MFLKGVTEKVDYFKSINVGAIWLSPIFKSPQDDFGYDISNYKMIDPLFGTMADFDRLRDAFHNNGELCVIMCVVKGLLKTWIYCDSQG
jgi:alpha-glucosidase